MMNRSILLLPLLFSCAGTRVVERAYQRPNLDRLPLLALDVVVVSSTLKTAEPVLDSGLAFPPPKIDAPLMPGAEHDPTRDALVDAVERQLSSAGFDLQLLHGASVPTSTLTTTTSTPTPATLANETLKDVLDKSDRDAVLVIRVVPVSEFYVSERSGFTTIRDADGSRQRVPQRKQEKRIGRLLLGQAFLFDRKTGLRLWSRQIPDFPENGRLDVKDRFLRFGRSFDPKKAQLPDGIDAQAAEKFTQAMLSDFPKPTEGDQSARAELDAIDTTAERDRQAFYDESRFGLEIGLAWGLERVGTDVELEGEEIDSLGTGAVAPMGILRVVPQASYLAPGGLSFFASIPLGLASSSFSRGYFRDNPSAPNDRGRAFQVELSGVKSIGAQIRVGYALVLSPSLLLIPSGGAFFDTWFLSATPHDAVPNRTHIRAGAVGQVNCLVPLGQTFFFQGGTEMRLGVDSAGPLVVGFNLVVGAGVFL